MLRLAALLLVLVLAGPAHALTVYTDRASWEAAVAGPIYTETFDTVPDQAVYYGGSLSTPTFDLMVAPGSHGAAIIGGHLSGDLEPAQVPFFSDGSNTIVFDAPITAFAMDILSVSDGMPLPVGIGTDSFEPSAGFFGVVSDVSFPSVVFALGGGDSPRGYALDNLSMAPVTEPLGLGALTAISALLAARRRARG